MKGFGVYIHVPFCKSRCLYCDFFSTTDLDKREQYVQAVIREAQERVKGTVSTIYFGGGTPSMLSVEQLKRILHAIGTQAQEITLEANPGDLTLDKLRALRASGFNRLSIGIQSFRNEELQLIGRRHSADEARAAVKMAQAAGFDNISIDLMYALPNQTMENWHYNICEALKLNVQHISCYCLTYEPHTALTRLIENGTLIPADEDTENEMYDFLCNRLIVSRFEHYEVSNFARRGYYSRHNSSYWNNAPYIGLGAGAHSYDGHKRRWNISDLDRYITCCEFEEETLTDEQKEMERIMLGLRTSAGITYNDSLLTKAQPFLDKGQLQLKNNRLVATQSGLHILNRIIEALV